MLHKCAVSLTNMMLGNQTIAEDDHEVYVYGWEMILSTAASGLTMLFISFFAHQLIGTILFMICFLTLRAYAGGYHADTYLGCFLTMMVIYSLVLLINIFTPTVVIPVAILVMVALAVVLVFVRAPQEHPNRPIQGEERVLFKFRSRAIIIVEAVAVLVVLFFFPSFLAYGWWITTGMTAAALSLLWTN